jgi:hypothetical protein
MATNILIGVGGTGAKIVEATLIQLLAGNGVEHMNDPVYVCLVDQDESNGNVARTRDLLKKIRMFQGRWAKTQKNGIDWSDAAAPVFGGVRIENLFQDGGQANLPVDMWKPTDALNLHQVISAGNLSEDKTQLLHLLFQNSDNELKLDLRAGYQGRAHVGAAAILTSVTDPNDRFIKRIEELIVGPGENHRVNICLVGSSFGGTGASGFPILARKINELRKVRNREGLHTGYRSNVSVGGVLMLPYFSFRTPPEAERDEVVAPEDLMPKAQMALEYYEDLVKKEKPFDQLYILGWDRFMQFDYYEKGNANQVNPATLPELFAATAVGRFFTSPLVSSSANTDSGDFGRPACQLLVSSRQTANVGWLDVPSPYLEKRFGAMLRFAGYWHYHVAAELDKRPGFLSRPNWATRLARAPKGDDSREDLDALKSLLSHVLLWAATVQHMAAKEFSGESKLWDFGPLINGGFLPTPQLPIILLDPRQLTEQQSLAALNFLTRRENGSSVEFTSAAFDTLENMKPEALGTQHRQIGALLAAVYTSVMMNEVRS